MPTILDATVVNQAYDTSGNGGRKLVRLSNGWLVAGMKNGTTDVKFYKSEDNGQTWSLLTTIPESNPSLSMVAKGTDIYVLLAYSTVVRSYKIDGLTGATSSFMSVDSGQNSVGECSLTINETGTELHAAWASKNSIYPYSFNIRYAKGTINADGSVTWGAVEQVTTRNTTGIPFYLEPSIVINNNGVPVIICSFDGGSDFNKCIKAIEKSSDNWSERNVYDSVSIYYAQSSPSACVDKNGRIWVAWHGYDATDTTRYNIRVSYSDDGGVTWSAPTKLTSGNTRHNCDASITVNRDNEVFVVFNGQPSNTSEYYVIKKIKYSSGSWGAVTEITTSDSYYPSTLLDTSIEFSEPIFIYKNVASAKVGFYGTWKVATISVTPGYIGQKSDKSNILTYSITTDGEMSDIIEKINDVTIATRTNPTNGQEFTVSLNQSQWDAIQYGNAHTLTIEMDSYTWTYTFDKRLNANDDILSAVKGVQDLQDHLNGIKAQLGEAIRANGGTVNDADAWSAFVSAVGNMNVSKRASGTIQSSSSEMLFNPISGSTRNVYYVEVTGLTFVPSMIYLVWVDSVSGNTCITIYNLDNDFQGTANNADILTLQVGNNIIFRYRLEGNAYITGTGFRLPFENGSRSVKWYAFE